MREIWFDMDGTIVNFYGVKDWLNDIINEDARPYEEAKPLVNLSSLARVLNNLQKKGYKIGIISWLARGSSENYDRAVTSAKIGWLNSHMPSVKWDRIEIVAYGTYKEKVCNYSKGILFDDEENNRKYWKGQAYNVENIIEVLKGIE